MHTGSRITFYVLIEQSALYKRHERYFHGFAKDLFPVVVLPVVCSRVPSHT